LTATVLRTLRTLRGESLDLIGAELGFKKSTLSTCERFPDTAGPKLRRALERRYSLPWRSLSKEIDGTALAAAIAAQLISNRKNQNA
jgi:hypothetical protein